MPEASSLMIPCLPPTFLTTSDRRPGRRHPRYRGIYPVSYPSHQMWNTTRRGIQQTHRNVEDGYARYGTRMAGRYLEPRVAECPGLGRRWGADGVHPAD